MPACVAFADAALVPDGIPLIAVCSCAVAAAWLAFAVPDCQPEAPNRPSAVVPTTSCVESCTVSEFASPPFGPEFSTRSGTPSASASGNCTIEYTPPLVPAYSTVGSTGSRASDSAEYAGSPTLIDFHVAPKSVLLYTPPGFAGPSPPLAA